MFAFAHSTMDRLRERFHGTMPPVEEFNVRETGQIHRDQFVAAGDHLTKWFPMWAWTDDTHVDYNKLKGGLPPVGRQVLICRKLPCKRRLDAFVDDATTQQETMVRDGDDFRDNSGSSVRAEDDGWLQTGDLAASQEARARDVRTVDESGNMADREPDEPDDIPDMEFEEDDPEELIPGPKDESVRYYDVHIVYSPAYFTPRVYLMGYDAYDHPLPPRLMLEDIMGDYTDKTVTLEDFLYTTPTKPASKPDSNSKSSAVPGPESSADPDTEHAIHKMASIHPCKHGELMKTLFNRADNALKIRREKQRKGLVAGGPADLQSIVGDIGKLNLADGRKNEPKGKGEEDWEVLDDDDSHNSEETAISINQYLVVFLKFLASVTPTIEIDNTMAI